MYIVTIFTVTTEISLFCTKVRLRLPLNLYFVTALYVAKLQNTQYGLLQISTLRYTV